MPTRLCHAPRYHPTRSTTAQSTDFAVADLVILEAAKLRRAKTGQHAGREFWVARCTGSQTAAASGRSSSGQPLPRQSARISLPVDSRGAFNWHRPPSLRAIVRTPVALSRY
jgi:hypothetical protein